MIRMRFRLIILIIGFMAIGVYGQKQSKTFNEVFNVTAETVLDINTSNTDIEFETWDKNQITIEAIIEIDGATPEEAAEYFKNGGIDIMGNSKKIEITTGVENTWIFKHSTGNLQNLNIEIPNFHFEMPEHPEIPEMPEMAEFHFEDFHIDLTDMPMPPVPAVEFDYKAYKKDGEKYLRKWQKKFEKGFDSKYEKKMEEWSAKMEVKREVMEKRREEMEAKREVMMTKRLKAQEKRMEAQEKRMEAQVEVQEKRAAEMEKRMEEREVRSEALLERRHSDREDTNIFYYSNEGENKKYKIKKTLKIKMPKGTKIEMNVRHGEVKLADNVKNLNAKLSYSVLVANTIDGNETSIYTSYSPVSVQKWNYGLLQADYSEKVELSEVLNLRLSTTSSDVTINNIIESAVIHNKMGPLTIKAISKNFKEVDVSLQNAEFTCPIPNTAFVVEIEGTHSTLATPASLILERTKNNNTTFHEGYHLNNKNDKAIIINSKYSEVVLKEN